MAQAKMNDTVTVHYTGSFTDGSVFDSSMEREPLEFTIGEGMVIPGFEDGILGMNEGDSKKIHIEAQNAYGLHREDLLTTIGREQMPRGLEIYAGMALRVRSPDGGIANVIVKEFNEKTVTLDLNHPLAGKDLVFDLTLVKIK